MLFQSSRILESSLESCGILIHSHGGLDWVVVRLVSCCRLLLACSVNSLIIVPLDVGCHTVHSNYLSLSDCVSLIRYWGT